MKNELGKENVRELTSELGSGHWREKSVSRTPFFTSHVDFALTPSNILSSMPGNIRSHTVQVKEPVVILSTIVIFCLTTKVRTYVRPIWPLFCFSRAVESIDKRYTQTPYFCMKGLHYTWFKTISHGYIYMIMQDRQD